MALTSIDTPPVTMVHLKGWAQQRATDYLLLLQQAIDGPGVDDDYIDECMQRHEQFVSVLSKCHADGMVWLGLYTFTLRSDAVVGILVSKKVTEFASERHCAVFAKHGSEVGIYETLNIRGTQTAYYNLLMEREAYIPFEPDESQRYVWDEDFGVVDTANEVLVGTEAGAIGRLLLYYVVFVLQEKKVFSVDELVRVNKACSSVVRGKNIEIEKLEIADTHIVASVLVPMDIAVVDFTERLIEKCTEWLRPEHFVTNLRKPSRHEIDTYIKGLRNH